MLKNKKGNMHEAFIRSFTGLGGCCSFGRASFAGGSCCATNFCWAGAVLV
jgi:hypothetical protein